MLIYEKDNKLNINFENKIDGEPDLQIGKNGDKTEVVVDGNSNPTIPVPVLPEDVGKAIVVNEDGSYALANAGGSNEPLILEFATENPYTVTTPLADIKTAIEAGRTVYFKYEDRYTEYYTLSEYITDNSGLRFICFNNRSGPKIRYDGGTWSVY